MKKLSLLLIIAFTSGLLIGCGTDNAAEEQEHMVEEELNPGNDNRNHSAK